MQGRHAQTDAMCELRACIQQLYDDFGSSAVSEIAQSPEHAGMATHVRDGIAQLAAGNEDANTQVGL